VCVCVCVCAAERVFFMSPDTRNMIKYTKRYNAEAFLAFLVFYISKVCVCGCVCGKF